MEFLSKLLQGISFLPAVISGIEGLFGGRSGAQKKDAALSFVQAALSMSDAVTNRQIVDEEKFKQGLSKLIDGTVRLFERVSVEKDSPVTLCTSYPISSLQLSRFFFTSAMN